MLKLIRREKLLVAYAILTSLVIIALAIAVGITASLSNKGGPDIHGGDNRYLENVRKSKLGMYMHAAVSVDAGPCAEISVDVLRQNGTAVDAAIAALVCSGVVNSHSMGLGGGFLMVIHSRANDELSKTINPHHTVFLDAREVAPLGATKDMFSEDPTKSSTEGPHSIAVPGEIKGYFEAKARFGNPELSMAQLFQPTIDMCRNGIRTTQSLAKALKRREALIRQNPKMSSVFIKDGNLLEAGSIHLRPELALTLETLAQEGEKAFYGGELGKKVVEELRSLGSLITLNDLQSYSVKWKEPVTVPIEAPGGDRLEVVSSNVPGSGAVLGGLLKVMGMLGCNQTTTLGGFCMDSPQFYGQFVEAMKFAFAQRSHLGDNDDPDQAQAINETLDMLRSDDWAQEVVSKIKSMTRTSPDPEFYTIGHKLQRSAANDKGTTHISIMGPNGEAVSVTSTINYYFGSVLMSPSTGIIFNNEMDDFTTNPNVPNIYNIFPSEVNTIRPGKRPTSSMCPTLIMDSSKNVRTVIGASGGPAIISSVAGVLLQHIFLGENIKSSIDYPRFHHQLLPMKLFVENGCPSGVQDYLGDELGHEISLIDPFTSTYSAGRVQATSLNPDTSIITANNDFRKNGAVGGF